MKKCFKCNQEKQLEEFYKHHDMEDGYLNKCIDCTKKDVENHTYKNRKEYEQYHKNYRATHKDQQKNYDLKRKYGITLEIFNEMFFQQEGKCAICRRHSLEFKKGLCVDHCHNTGKIRGLLCSNCNSAIGKLNEDPNLFAVALEYLGRHS
jgi:hypothetical protein